MKLSVSLPEADVAFLDRYAAEHDQPRSAALQRAVSLLRAETLGEQYAQAFAEWDGSDDAALWEHTVGDGR